MKWFWIVMLACLIGTGSVGCGQKPIDVAKGIYHAQEIAFDSARPIIEDACKNDKLEEKFCSRFSEIDRKRAEISDAVELILSEWDTLDTAEERQEYLSKLSEHVGRYIQLILEVNDIIKEFRDDVVVEPEESVSRALTLLSLAARSPSPV